MLFSKKDEEVNPEEVVEEKDEPVEDSPKEPDPVDVHAFIDEKRRYAEDEALKIANMLAEEYHGVIEPLDVPNDLGLRCSSVLQERTESVLALCDSVCSRGPDRKPQQLWIQLLVQQSMRRV